MKKIALWKKKKVNGKGTAQPQWDFEPYPSMRIGCKSVILHQSCAAQEEVNAGNETQDFIWHVLTEYIDTLHKILWKEITCVSSSINACPITTQSFDNGPVNTGAMNICLSLKYIRQVYYKTPKIKPGTYFNTDQGDTMGLKRHALRPESFCKKEFAVSFHLAHLGKHRALGGGLNPGITHKVLSILWHAELFRHLAAMPSAAVAWNLPLRFWGGDTEQKLCLLRRESCHSLRSKACPEEVPAPGFTRRLLGQLCIAHRALPCKYFHGQTFLTAARILVPSPTVLLWVLSRRPSGKKG